MYLFTPKIAYAATPALDNFILSVDAKIIDPLIAFIFALAVGYFLYGVLVFLMNQENEEKKTSGKQHMLWGVIGMTIMMGVYFLLGVVISTFGITGVDPNPDKAPDKQVNLPDYVPPSGSFVN